MFSSQCFVKALKRGQYEEVVSTSPLVNESVPRQLGNKPMTRDEVISKEKARESFRVSHICRQRSCKSNTSLIDHPSSREKVSKEVLSH